MERQNIASGSPWEPIVGFSRAVRAGDHVFVAGTIANDNQGNIHHEDDAEAQCAMIIDKVRTALEQVGASLEEVVLTRTYITNIKDTEAVGRAHKSAFGAIRPVSTLVGITALAHPGALVEMEATAVLGARANR